MSKAKNFDSKLTRILKRQKLYDLSQYLKADFFDEIPFYARYAEVSFLKPLGREEADKILIEFSLQYLEALVQYTRLQAMSLATVTVVDLGESDFLVPNIFVCNGLVEKRLKGKLVLQEPKKLFSMRILKIVENLGLADKYQVLEDELTIPGGIRVFIGHRVSPNSIGIDSFKKAVFGQLRPLDRSESTHQPLA